jgi:hypothetical protein
LLGSIGNCIPVGSVGKAFSKALPHICICSKIVLTIPYGSKSKIPL